MKPGLLDLETELDRLFALPPKEFVPARNALEARLRAAGDVQAAARIKALKRPSVPAWAVNQLQFEAPKVLAGLLASAKRLRARTPDIPDAMQARREAVAEARKKAAEVLVKGGHPASPQTMQRISSTLEALATYGNTPERGVAGRLTEELSAPGFDDLAALGILHGAAGAASQADRPKRAPVATPRRIEGKNSRANRIEEIAAEKRKEAERAHASLLEAEGRADSFRQKREELEKALAEVERQERAHAPALSAARRSARKAERAVRRRPGRSSPLPG